MFIKEKIKKLLIFYIPGLLTFAFNCFCYLSPGLIIAPENYIHINTPVDDMLPLVPAFLLFYFGSYLQWFLYYIEQNDLDNEETYRVFMGEMIGKTICWLCFVFFPVTLRRPEITGHSFFDLILKLTYRIDKPCCLFPSIHCFQSWMHLRFCRKHRSTKITLPVALFTIGVFASTVLIKQHLLMDIAGGVLVAEFGQFVSNRCDLYLKFESFCKKIRERLTDKLL